MAIMHVCKQNYPELFILNRVSLALTTYTMRLSVAAALKGSSPYGSTAI